MKNILLLTVISFPVLMGCLKKKKVEEVSVILCSINSSLLDNTKSIPEVTTQDTLSSKIVGLRFDLNFTFLGSPSCDATQEIKPKEVFVSNNLEDIEIITNITFDQNHPAGSDISEYFYVYKSQTYFSVVYYYNNLPTFRPTQFPVTEQMDALLMHLPENAGDFQFTTRFYMTDGSVVESISPQIHLLP